MGVTRDCPVSVPKLRQGCFGLKRTRAADADRWMFFTAPRWGELRPIFGIWWYGPEKTHWRIEEPTNCIEFRDVVSRLPSKMFLAVSIHHG